MPCCFGSLLSLLFISDLTINKWMQTFFIDTFYFEEFMAFFFVCLAVTEVFFLTVMR